MGPPVIQSLFITLKRSLASTRDTHVRILKSLGLQRRQQTVERKNAPAVRGALQKVGVGDGHAAVVPATLFMQRES